MRRAAGTIAAETTSHAAITAVRRRTIISAITLTSARRRSYERNLVVQGAVVERQGRARRNARSNGTCIPCSSPHAQPWHVSRRAGRRASRGGGRRARERRTRTTPPRQIGDVGHIAAARRNRPGNAGRQGRNSRHENLRSLKERWVRTKMPLDSERPYRPDYVGLGGALRSRAPQPSIETVPAPGRLVRISRRSKAPAWPRPWS